MVATAAMRGYRPAASPTLAKNRRRRARFPPGSDQTGALKREAGLGVTDPAGDAGQAQRQPGDGDRGPRTRAPDRQAGSKSPADGQRGARTEAATGGREDAQGGGAAHDRAGASGEAGAGRPREGGGANHHGRRTASTDGRIYTGSTADAHGAASVEHRGDDRRHREGGAEPGAREWHDAGEGEGMFAARNQVLPAWGRRGPAGRDVKG